MNPSNKQQKEVRLTGRWLPKTCATQRKLEQHSAWPDSLSEHLKIQAMIPVFEAHPQLLSLRATFHTRAVAGQEFAAAAPRTQYDGVLA